MKSTFRILFYLRSNRTDKDGRSTILVRITVDAQRVVVNSKLSVQAELWDGKAGRMRGKTYESREINSRIDQIRAALTNHYNTIFDRESTVTAEKVKNAYLGFTEKQYSLLSLYKKYLEDFTSLVTSGNKSKATLQKYTVTYKHLYNFMQAKYQLSDIAIKDINHEFITDFEIYLRTACKCGNNTTYKFMQFFKRIIIIAKNNGWIYADPFANYKIQIEKVDRGYLTQQELNTIINKKFATDRLTQVRDIFVFSCFTGLAYIDVKQLTTSHIRTSFDGNLWIMTKREKTHINSDIPLLLVAEKIVKKYEGQLPNNKLLPVLSNQKMNSYLKEIADVCGIEKNLTYHLARHTFATTVTLSNGVPIESVSKMLGHTNIKTTQIYARITNEKVGNDMNILAQKLDSYNTENLQN